MGDLKSKPLIVLKGFLFLVIVLTASVSLYVLNPDWLTVLLIVLLIWASARFYYFLFYVLEKYVDPALKYSGIGDMLRQLLRRRGCRPNQFRRLPYQSTHSFWSTLETLLDTGEIKIDRPRGSRHPNWPEIVYPLDYGYLEGSKSGDGNEIDVWLGSLPGRKLTAVAVTVDLHKRDSEIKLLVGCSEEDIAVVREFHNSGPQSAVILTRNVLFSTE